MKNPKIDLKSLKELESLTLIRSYEDLARFLATLRQDLYPKNVVEKLNLPSKLASWLASQKPPNLILFFAVYNKKDGRGKNGGWGYFELLECLVIRDSDRKVHVFKNLLEKFDH